MTTISENDRFLRQQELVPRDRLVNLKVTVIGVGAVGMSRTARPVFGPTEAPTDEAAEWRSTRSSRRPGKTVTWRRGAG